MEPLNEDTFGTNHIVLCREVVAATSEPLPTDSETSQAPVTSDTSTAPQPTAEATREQVTSSTSSTTTAGQIESDATTSSAQGTLDVGGQGLSTGDVTAVLLSVVILVVVVAVVVLFVYVCKHRRKPLAERAIRKF